MVCRIADLLANKKSLRRKLVVKHQSTIDSWFTSIFPSSLWPEYLTWVPIESLGCKEMTSACVMFFHVMYCAYPRFLGFLKNQQVNEALWEVQCRMEHLAPWCPAMLTTILLSLIIIHQSELWIYFWTSNYMAPHFFSLETSSMIFVGFSCLTQSSMRIEPILGIHTVDGSFEIWRVPHQLRLVVYRLPVYPPLFRTGLIHLRWCKISEPSTVPCLVSIHSQLGWSFSDFWAGKFAGEFTWAGFLLQKITKWTQK